MKRNYKQISGRGSLRRYAPRKRTTFRRTVIPRMPSPEKKFLDIQINMAVDLVGAQGIVNNLVLGNTSQTRVGQRIAITSMELRVLTSSTIATGTDQAHRWMVFVDHNTNGLAPVLGEQLNTISTLAMHTMLQRQRFKILVDKAYPVSGSAEDGSYHYEHVYLRFRKPIVVTFNAGNAGTVADISTNSIYFFACGSNAAGVTAGNAAGVSRIRYVDV